MYEYIPNILEVHIYSAPIVSCVCHFKVIFPKRNYFVHRADQNGEVLDIQTQRKRPSYMCRWNGTVEWNSGMVE